MTVRVTLELSGPLPRELWPVSQNYLSFPGSALSVTHIFLILSAVSYGKTP